MTNKVPYIVIASTIAMLLLVLIQVKWMQQSRNLIEEQFDQKVSMALCMAVDEVSETESAAEVKIMCNTESKLATNCCADNLTLFLENDNIKRIVSNSLSHYNIDMAFNLEVSARYEKMCMLDDAPTYSCSLSPLIKSDDHNLKIDFPGKQVYVLKKMGLMLGSSIVILALILCVFIYANYYLIKQQRLSKRNRDFFNHMAHEFRTPLTNIGLATKLLQKKSDEKLVSIIAEENAHLSDQVDRVLSMACMEKGDYQISKSRIVLKDFLESLMTQMDMVLTEKNVNIKLDFSDDNLSIEADRFHLTNAIRNIVDNAIKYNENKPSIHFFVTSIDDKVLIKIQDNGIGIKKLDQDLVFRKFHRLDKEESYRNKGFGLGLSYVQKIIELHKAEINIFSELNRGTRFELSFPQITAE